MITYCGLSQAHVDVVSGTLARTAQSPAVAEQKLPVKVPSDSTWQLIVCVSWLLKNVRVTVAFWFAGDMTPLMVMFWSVYVALLATVISRVAWDLTG